MLFQHSTSPLPFLKLKLPQWAEEWERAGIEGLMPSPLGKRFVRAWMESARRAAVDEDFGLPGILESSDVGQLPPAEFWSQILLPLSDALSAGLPDAAAVRGLAWLTSAGTLHQAQVLVRGMSVQAGSLASQVAVEMERACPLGVDGLPLAVPELRRALQGFLGEVASQSARDGLAALQFRVMMAFERRLLLEYRLPSDGWGLLLLKLRQQLRSLAGRHPSDELGGVFGLLDLAVGRFEVARLVYDCLRADSEVTAEQAQCVAAFILLEAAPSHPVATRIYSQLQPASLAGLTGLVANLAKQPWYLRLKPHFERAQLDGVREAATRIEQLAGFGESWRLVREEFGESWVRLSEDLAQGLRGEERARQLAALIEELAYRALWAVRVCSGAGAARQWFVDSLTAQLGLDPSVDVWRKAPQIAAALAKQLGGAGEKVLQPGWMAGLFGAVTERLKLARETPVRWAVDLQPSLELVGAEGLGRATELGLVRAFRQMAVSLWWAGEEGAAASWRGWFAQALLPGSGELASESLAVHWESLWEEAVAAAEGAQSAALGGLCRELREGQAAFFAVASLRQEVAGIAEAVADHVFRVLPEYAERVGEAGLVSCRRDNTLTLLELCSILESDAEDPVLALTEWWSVVVGSYLATRPPHLFEANLDGLFEALTGRLGEGAGRYLFQFVEGAYRENLGVSCRAARRPVVRAGAGRWWRSAARRCSADLGRELGLSAELLRLAVLESLEDSEVMELTGAAIPLLPKFQAALWQLGDGWLAAAACREELSALRRVAGTGAAVFALRRIESHLLRRYFDSGVMFLATHLPALASVVTQQGLGERWVASVDGVAKRLGELLPAHFPELFAGLAPGEVGSKCERDQRLVLEHWGRCFSEGSGPLLWVNGLRYTFELLLPFVQYPEAVWAFLAQMTERLMAPTCDAVEHLELVAWASTMERAAGGLAVKSRLCRELFAEGSYVFVPRPQEEGELRAGAGLLMAAEVLELEDEALAALAERVALTADAQEWLGEEFLSTAVPLWERRLGGQRGALVAEVWRSIRRRVEQLTEATGGGAAPSVATLALSVLRRDRVQVAATNGLSMELSANERPAVAVWRTYAEQLGRENEALFSAAERDRRRLVLQSQGPLLSDDAGREPWFWPSLVSQYALAPQRSRGPDMRFDADLAESFFRWLGPVMGFLKSVEWTFLEVGLTDLALGLPPELPEAEVQRARFYRMRVLAHRWLAVRACWAAETALAESAAASLGGASAAVLRCLVGRSADHKAQGIGAAAGEDLLVLRAVGRRLAWSALWDDMEPPRAVIGDRSAQSSEAGEIGAEDGLVAVLAAALHRVLPVGQGSFLGLALDRSRSGKLLRVDRHAGSMALTAPLGLLSFLERRVEALAVEGAQVAQSINGAPEAVHLMPLLREQLSGALQGLRGSGDPVGILVGFKEGVSVDLESAAGGGLAGVLLAAYAAMRRALVGLLRLGEVAFWDRWLASLSDALAEVVLGRWILENGAALVSAWTGATGVPASVASLRVPLAGQVLAAWGRSLCREPSSVVAVNFSGDLALLVGRLAADERSTVEARATVSGARDSTLGVGWQQVEQLALSAAWPAEVRQVALRWLGHGFLTIRGALGLAGAGEILSGHRDTGHLDRPSGGLRGFSTREQRLFFRGLLAAASAPRRGRWNGQVLLEQLALRSPVAVAATPGSLLDWLNRRFGLVPGAPGGDASGVKTPAVAGALATVSAVPPAIQQALFGYREWADRLAQIETARLSQFGWHCLVQPSWGLTRELAWASQLARLDPQFGLTEADGADTLAGRLLGWPMAEERFVELGQLAARTLQGLPTEVARLAQLKPKNAGFFKKDPADYRTLATEQTTLATLSAWCGDTLLAAMLAGPKGAAGMENAEGEGAGAIEAISLGWAAMATKGAAVSSTLDLAWVALTKDIADWLRGQLGPEHPFLQRLVASLRDFPTTLVGAKLLSSTQTDPSATKSGDAFQRWAALACLNYRGSREVTWYLPGEDPSGDRGFPAAERSLVERLSSVLRADELTVLKARLATISRQLN